MQLALAASGGRGRGLSHWCDCVMRKELAPQQQWPMTLSRRDRLPLVRFEGSLGVRLALVAAVQVRYAEEAGATAAVSSVMLGR